MKSNPAKQRQAMRLLATGLSVQNVADRMHVHRTTIWRWYNVSGMAEYYLDHARQNADKTITAQ